MTARYRIEVQAGGKVTIPAEICKRDDFQLIKGVPIRQSIDKQHIVLYKLSKESAHSSTGYSVLEGKGVLILEQDYSEKLTIKIGDPLYLWVEEDLIIISKAHCEKCHTDQQLVEYADGYFMCRSCVAATIYREEERRR